MDELFRYSLTRPPSATEAETISLSRRTNFQAELQNLAKTSPNEWSPLEQSSFLFLKGAAGDIVKLPENKIVLLLEELRSGTESIPGEADFGNAFKKLLIPFKGLSTDISEQVDALADYFIAFLIIRSNGISFSQ